MAVAVRENWAAGHGRLVATPDGNSVAPDGEQRDGRAGAQIAPVLGGEVGGIRTPDPIEILGEAVAGIPRKLGATVGDVPHQTNKHQAIPPKGKTWS